MAPTFTASTADKEGIWGKRTSTLDWCEENYVVTVLVAEFWNTISNWIMIIPPLIAAYMAWKDKMELRIICCFLSFAAVGLGSLGFHCTLLYEMQLFDELPMIYGTCIFLYTQIECNGKEGKLNTKLALFFIIISMAITVIYITVPNPLVFQTAYGILAGMLFIQTLYRCSYGTGFILWNIDNNFCPAVRIARESLPPLIKPVTQLHAWWHTLAGAGTYISNMFTVHLRLKCLGYPVKLELFWRCVPVFRPLKRPMAESPSFTIISKIDTYKVNGILNNNYK